MRKRLGNVDLETGELMQGVAVWIRVKYPPYDKGWFMANQEALLTMAQDKDITGECYRVLMVLFGRLDFENWLHVPQKEIAETLDMDHTQVSRSIKRLVQKGILLRSPYGYRLNPYYGWKGKVQKLKLVNNP